MSFRMELYGEALFAGVTDSFAAAVIGVDKGLDADVLQAVGIYRIAVILAGDKGPSVFQVCRRLVAAAVPVFELEGCSAHGKGSHLMPETDAEDGELSD